MLINKDNLTKKNEGALHAVSLFSNCGAGDVGYRKAGFTFDVMAELNPKRLEVCLLNHPDSVGIEGDLRETWTEVVKTYKKKTKNAPLSLLAACPPCQGMSSARGLRGTHNDPDAGSKDKRNLLAVIIANVAKELKPKIIVVENVPEFLSKKVRHPETNQPITASNLLIEMLSNEYMVFPIVLDMCDFGIPQSRKRSFLTFVRLRLKGLSRILKNNFAPYPTLQGTPITLKQALQNFNLPKLDSKSKETTKSLEENFQYHVVPVLPADMYKWVEAIPTNGGSAWNNNNCIACKNLNKSIDVYCTSCGELLPKPVVKEKDGTYRLVKGFKTSYKRMDPNKPAPTILTASTTISSHNTIHPFENRVFSLLECMKFQTFDDEFNWGDTFTKYGPITMRKMVGEAVPPKFTELHGKVLKSILEFDIEYPKMYSYDKRCTTAIKKLKKAK